MDTPVTRKEPLVSARQRFPVTVTLDMIPLPQKEARRLMATAAIIEHRGWCRGQLEDRRGHVCMVRAYQLADPKDPRGGYGLLAVCLVVDTDLTAAQWQDGNGQSRSRVVAVLRRTAHALMEVA